MRKILIVSIDLTGEIIELTTRDLKSSRLTCIEVNSSIMDLSGKIGGKDKMIREIGMIEDIIREIKIVIKLIL
jgi:hypothetical protein